MAGKAIAFGFFVTAFAATPAFAQGAEETGRARETCAEVSFDGDFKLSIPCPPGTRPLLETLPRPAEPPPRRDIVIDPEWPHDQAIVQEQDWPHDWAMIAPQADSEEERVPLFGDLPGAIEQDVRESKVRQLLEDWLPGKLK